MITWLQTVRKNTFNLVWTIWRWIQFFSSNLSYLIMNRGDYSENPLMLRFWTSQLNLLIADKNARRGSGATQSRSEWSQIFFSSQPIGSKIRFDVTLVHTEWRRIHAWNSYQQSISLIEVFENGALVDFHYRWDCISNDHQDRIRVNFRIEVDYITVHSEKS